MKEIFDWVPWFQELARRIGEGGRQTLAEKAREVDWGPTDPPLLKFGDENIDPFSFFYYLAARNSQDNWKTVYRSVAEVFEKRISIDSPPEEGFYFPTGRANNTLFHGKDSGNLDLLWKLFEQAVSDSIRSHTFEAALEIKGVGVSKLTQALFLIAPTGFLPFDGESTLALEIGKYDKPPFKITWKEYRQEMEKIKKAFPGCECYEIQMFAYLWKNGLIPVNFGNHYQVSTNVYDDDDDYWGDDFKPNNWVYTGGPGNRRAWPAQGELAPRGRYPLDRPVRGDIVLVRFGQKGRGIGLVYKNNYTDKLADDSRLHVLWLNKMSANLAGNFRLQGFSRAWEPTQQAFRSTAAYSPTFELLERIGGVAPPPGLKDSITVSSESVEHPLNQILYGPPGTGKTWNAVNCALAIVDGVDVNQIGEEHREWSRDLRFDPNAGTGQIAVVTFHQSFSYEDFVEGIRPKLEASDEIAYELRDGIFKRIANTAQKDPEQRYVLIIDEINRGNIPKILGELITLVEDSRRLGKPGETKVTLPYSNDDFGVPENLHIIGTMNTADRSILLLDTALRRRFDFVEMMPDLEHKLISDDIQGVKIRKMLKAMNERISLLLDREHQIGHTYLFHVKDMKALADKFQNAIFPLLQEYFYDDWSKIREVLGRNGFVVKQELDYAKKLQNSDLVDEDRIVYERLQDGDPKWRDPDEYKKIYSDNSNSESS